MNSASSCNPRRSTLDLLIGIGRKLSRRRRLQLALLSVVMLLNGAAELASLGSILPFLAVLTDPEWLWRQRYVQAFAVPMGIVSSDQLLLPATIIFASLAVTSVAIRLFNLWLNGQLTAAVGTDLSCEAYRRTLFQPYSNHVKTNSSTVIAAMTAHIARTVGALAALLQLITASVVALELLIGLLLINTKVAFGAAVLFGSIYSLLAFFSRRELTKNSSRIAVAANEQLKSLQEGLGAIRDVLLDNSQNFYIGLFRSADQQFRQPDARNQFLSVFPRYALEGVVMVAMAIFGSLLVLKHGVQGGVIPLLGALALGAQRLLPALQQMYVGWASLKGVNSDLISVLKMLEQPMPEAIDSAGDFVLRKEICFQAVHFSYSADVVDVLSGVDFHIVRGERVGFIGSTGSGKSTTVDLLMGLLIPTKGQILVDGCNIHDKNHPEYLISWRKNIAHVPQNIYLADGSIAENIAFGISRDNIDMSRVRMAARQAQIATFVESRPEGYASFVGERGIQLSGGQRQRIGIARALYKQANVLVLDEATSALDDETEQSVMRAINALSRALTIVMIAHRLSTVRNCDRIIRLDHGVVTADGPPIEVLG